MDWVNIAKLLEIRSFAKRGRTLTILLSAAAVVAAGTGVVHAARAAAAAKTTMDGVYDDAQAQRGKTGYSQNCAACHMDDLSGSGQALPLAGDAFMGTWEGQSVADLMGLIHDTMPQDKPGTLSPEQSLDIVAYLLLYNQFPAGTDELKNDPDALKSIIITKKSNPPSK
jgi:S-disulfanyl-L-cysteine oxidoreductase SoxD